MMPNDFGEAIGFAVMAATFAAAIAVLIREYRIGTRTKIETAKKLAELRKRNAARAAAKALEKFNSIKP